MPERIFRIQDNEGRGPWRPGFSHLWVKPRPDHDNLPPWMFEFPHIDIKSIESGHFGSGCRNTKQLRRWFTKNEYKTLVNFGFKAVMMDVEEVLAESEKQLLFRRMFPLNQYYTVVRLY